MIRSSILGGLVFSISDSIFFHYIRYFDQNFKSLSTSEPSNVCSDKGNYKSTTSYYNTLGVFLSPSGPKNIK